MAKKYRTFCLYEATSIRQFHYFVHVSRCTTRTSRRFLSRNFRSRFFSSFVRHYSHPFFSGSLGTVLLKDLKQFRLLLPQLQLLLLLLQLFCCCVFFSLCCPCWLSSRQILDTCKDEHAYYSSCCYNTIFLLLLLLLLLLYISPYSRYNFFCYCYCCCCFPTSWVTSRYD